ncbi:unnamed protein product [Paramecium primaurelia]|uniref:glucosamine-6-phosphate deaminase n=1 Tax=Paramecium primaurelia TaxID=5886 RepID=A0A8S1NSB8_PARPR|nr:unnamed protein product [Paramecium primaurelia]
MNNTTNPYEKIPVKVFNNSRCASVWIAGEISQIIKQKQAQQLPCVLGLATGSTPIQVYKELIRLHKEEGLSFQNVITFNLDEYFPIPKESLHSYYHFMHENLFNHVDIKKENIHIPDGTLIKEQIEDFCQYYENLILEKGGLDFQLLGIGSTGHIGFNEPGSSINSKTRLITLDRKTRADASSSFYGIENVPKYAITMGIGTILQAKKIIIAAFTEGKQKIASTVIEGAISSQYPATFLQNHKNTLFVLERASAQGLTRYQAPWLLEAQGLKGELQIKYDLSTAKKGVIWLSQKVGKPILRLQQEDYEDNGLLELITQIGQGNCGIVNLTVFRELSQIITGWPAGGRPDKLPESYFTQKKAISKQKIIIFSPHPDDDVICMGGTMKKLTNQGHEVHVVYMVSGNLAVFDFDALRFADVLKETQKMIGGNGEEFYEKVKKQIKEKKLGEVDGPDLAYIKTVIRRTEARSAALCTGVEEQNIHFLDLPFYETGKSTKRPLGDEDKKIVKDIILKIQPDQIYAAGDLTDPHGTHRVCLESILAVLPQVKEQLPNLNTLLYRGAWQEWELDKVTMAVPLSPDELYEKRIAIFKHQSQKDRPMFPGSDSREFWQRSESRNKETARLFTNLGFVNYEALECFVSLDVLLLLGEL